MIIVPVMKSKGGGAGKAISMVLVPIAPGKHHCLTTQAQATDLSADMP